jgi:hypothetical protein
MLVRLRLGQGKSQLRVAELLCAASGTRTVTRHEVSRWEREQRVPSGYWLRWLAVVLDAPLDELEQAVSVTRAMRTTAGRPPAGHWSMTRVTDVPDSDGWPPASPSGAARVGRWAVTDLRRLDDLIGGADLAHLVNAALRAELTALRASLAPLSGPGASAGAATDERPRQHHSSGAGVASEEERSDGGEAAPQWPRGPHERSERQHHSPGAGEATAWPSSSRRRRERLLRLAELAQLAGWVNGDAGGPAAARSAHRLGLRAAGAAGDRALVGHLLGAASHLTAAPARALALAKAGVDEVARAGSATARALLLHRVAHAAARLGDRGGCERALVAADRMYSRRRADLDPPWVYWLTEAEFAAMTGRCYAALGRPRLAIPLLTHGLAHIRQPRAASIYRSWLAVAHLDAGNADQSAQAAGAALLDAVRAGSVRAAARARAVHARLLAAAHGPSVTEYTRLAGDALDYLADRDPGHGRRLLARSG